MKTNRTFIHNSVLTHRVAIVMSLIMVSIFMMSAFSFTKSDILSDLDQERAYYRKMEIEIEKKTATLLSGMVSEPEYYNKTISFEKKDKIDAMLRMKKLLETKDIYIQPEVQYYFIRYIKKYAPYADNEDLIDYLQLIINKEKASALTAVSWSYSSTNAVNYAINWYDSYNTAYYPNCASIGGDCSNFVSQCMYAGGIPMNGSWYVYKLNNTYLAPTTVSQLDYSWDLASPSPWISAPEFYLKWYPIFSTDTYTANYVYNNQSTIYNTNYAKGDVVQILEKVGWWYEAYHTMIITGYSGGDFCLTYHSSNTINKPLHTIAASLSSGDYQFIFFNVQ